MALIQRRHLQDPASAARPEARVARASDFEVAASDAWQPIADEASLPESGDVLVSLRRFTSEREVFLARTGRLGVRVPNDTLPQLLAPVAEAAALIALELPTQRDGRSYSLAHWLRSRFGFRGELRATGKVVRDQLPNLARVGFDSFELARGSAEDALASFDDMSVHYQAAADQPLPLWKRAARS